MLERLTLVTDTPRLREIARRLRALRWLLEGSSGRSGGDRKSKFAPFPSLGNLRGLKSPLDPSQESKISDNELVTFKLRLQSAFLAPQETFRLWGWFWALRGEGSRRLPSPLNDG